MEKNGAALPSLTILIIISSPDEYLLSDSAFSNHFYMRSLLSKS